MRSYAAYLLFILLTVGCAAKKAAVAPAEPDYAGNWIIEIGNTPLGDVQGVLQLAKTEDGGYEGAFLAQGAEYKLNRVQADGDEVNALFYFSDYGIDVEIQLTGAPTGPLTGMTNDEYLTTAKRE